jgi:glycosyltransferase involved in cell wall biosynthesis
VTNAIAMVSNALEPPPDEGIRKCAHELAAILTAKGTRIYAISDGAPFVTRKLFLSRKLLGDLRKKRACAVIYVPTQSATLASFLRSAVLRSLGGAKVVMLALQPRALGTTGTMVARYARPDLLLTPSPTMLREAERAGVQTEYLELGADVSRFHPVPMRRKLELRRKYGFPANRPVALHIGHARRFRGFEWILHLDSGITRVVVIGRSLGFDQEVVGALRASGVSVLDHYVPDIHELYQLSDVYVFPVRDEQAAIAAPLSVLEAMACNLPVVTTPFGALPRMVSSGGGVFFVEHERDFQVAIAAALVLGRRDVRTREQVLSYSWTATCDAVVEAATGLCRET